MAFHLFDQTHTLLSQDYRVPMKEECDVWVALLKSKIAYMHGGEVFHDLSDHFPVWSHLVWDNNSQPVTPVGSPIGPSRKTDYDSDDLDGMQSPALVINV